MPSAYRRIPQPIARLLHFVAGAITALSLKITPVAAIIAATLFVLYELSETVRDVLTHGRLLTADWPEEELAEYLAGYLSGLAFLMVGWM